MISCFRPFALFFFLEKKLTSGSPPHSVEFLTLLQYFSNPFAVIIPSSVAPLSSPSASRSITPTRKGMNESGWASI